MADGNAGAAQKAAADEERLKALSEELRCLVCQNQTLADSNADLAVDLRNQVRAQIEQGKTDAQIKEYLVARYGDFVLYKPPVQGNTWLLWFGPFLLLLLGAVLWRRIQRRTMLSATAATAAASASSAASAPSAASAATGIGGSQEDQDSRRRLEEARRLLED